MKYHTRVSAGLKFTSDILSKQPQYCSDIWKFFRTFFNTHFYQHKWKLPSALLIETRGNFATILEVSAA